MKQSAPQLINILSICILVALLAACGSKPNTAPPALSAIPEPTAEITIPATAAAVLPTATAVLPTATDVPPTPAPTPTRMPGPLDYLLTTQDVPDVVTPFILTVNYLEEYEITTYAIHFLAATDQNYKLSNSIGIQSDPWTELPEIMDDNARPIEVPPLGLGSQAFENDNDPLDLTLRFYKGRAEVAIEGYGFDLETLVNLAKVVEARMPEVIPETPPIVFAEQLDEALFDKYFISIQIGSLNDQGEIEPASIFVLPSDNLCWGSQEKIDVPNHEIGIYDPQANEYVDKSSYFFGLSIEFPDGGCSSLQLPPGPYEFKFSVDNVLVKSIPFEIRLEENN
jgi:hypothetical protein